MAVLTAMSPEEAKALGARWGLEVTALRGVAAGSVNSSFALTLAGGEEVFLRVYEARNLAEAEDELAMLAHLAARGVPTPTPRRCPDGARVVAWRGKPAAVFPWVEGTVSCQRGVTLARAQAVGEALARVHLAGVDHDGSLPERFGPAQLTARLAGVARAGLAPDLRATLERLDRAVAALAAEAPLAPATLVHGDLFRDNVLWDGDRVAALLDFESASRGSAAYDLMVTTLAWCFGDALDLGLARALVASYAATRPLRADERADLHRAARAAAARFSVTRVTDYELRPRGAGVWKDYRRFVARLDVVESYAPDAWREALGVGARSPQREVDP